MREMEALTDLETPEPFSPEDLAETEGQYVVEGADL